MQSFLEKVAITIYSKHRNHMEDVCLVFPNRRPMVFFQKYLANQINAPVWSPQYFTIQEFMEELTGMRKEDSLALIFRLHEIYSKKKQKEEPMDAFLFWGEMLLADFDDVDKFLVDARDLFRNLRELKSFEHLFDYLDEKQVEAIRVFWSSFDPKKITEEQKRFIENWDILFPVYETFSKELKKDKIGYEGLIFRTVAQSIQQQKYPEIPGKKVVFIGFNALNPCEYELFRWLQKSNTAEFFWDVDQKYLQNNQHQAGRFLKRNMTDFPPPEDAAENQIISREMQTIKSWSTDFNTSQPVVMRHVLSEITKRQKPGTNTAIILADERLLFPVLNHIPENIDAINVTMGFPFAASNTASYIASALQLLQSHANKKGAQLYHYKPVMNLLKHPFSLQMEPVLSQKLVQNLLSKNRFRLTVDDVNEFGIFRMWFTPVNNLEDLFVHLISLLDTTVRYLLPQVDNKFHSLEMEFLYSARAALNKLESGLSGQKMNLTVNTGIKLVQRVLKNLNVPFSGEPLNGIQVMGILESRSLDFENVIILSTNEGKWPQKTAAPSYIPFNLRYAFGMPTTDHQDSIFTYYFYRLLHRSSEVHLIYSLATEGTQTGEKSRYLYQLELLEGYDIEHHHLSFPVSVQQNEPIVIPKDKDVWNKLNRYLEPKDLSLSPSALNTYLDCSLKFYFKYIKRLKEPDEFRETIDPMSFGNILHATLDAVYHDALLKELEPSDINNIRRDTGKIKAILRKTYAQEYLNKEKIQDESDVDGLMFDILYTYVQQVLEYDQSIAPMKLLTLEKPYSLALPLRVNDQTFNVNLAGTIDRTDRYQGTCRVIDYKTGKVDNRIKSLEELFLKDQKERNKAAFQTLLYAYLYSKNQKEPEAIVPGLYPIRDLNQKGFDFRLYIQPARAKKEYLDNFLDIAENFEKLLKETLFELFSNDVPFAQTSAEDTCKFCPYATVCERNEKK